jgi:hypothetical protein
MVKREKRAKEEYKLVIEVNILRFREVKTIKILQFFTFLFPKKKKIIIRKNIHFFLYFVCWGVLRVVIISTTYLLNILTENAKRKNVKKGSFCRPDKHMMRGMYCVCC